MFLKFFFVTIISVHVLIENVNGNVKKFKILVDSYVYDQASNSYVDDPNLDSSFGVHMYCKDGIAYSYRSGRNYRRTLHFGGPEEKDTIQANQESPMFTMPVGCQHKGPVHIYVSKVMNPEETGRDIFYRDDDWKHWPNVKVDIDTTIDVPTVQLVYWVVDAANHILQIRQATPENSSEGGSN